MRTEHEIIKELHALQSVVPSEKLRKRLQLLQTHLPSRTEGKSFSWIMLHTGIVFAAILLFVVGLGSSLVIAAAYSQPGGLLFPIKKAIVEAEEHFSTDQAQKTSVHHDLLSPVYVPVPTQILLQLQEPTLTPTGTGPTITPDTSATNRRGDKNVKGDSITPVLNNTKKRDEDQNPEQNHSTSENPSGFWQFFSHPFGNNEQ